MEYKTEAQKEVDRLNDRIAAREGKPPLAGAIGSGLLPCPFCGDRAEYLVLDDGGIQLHCENTRCWATLGPLYPSGRKHNSRYIKNKLRSQWNRRTPNAAGERLPRKAVCPCCKGGKDLLRGQTCVVCGRMK